jgi:hypothetical protein
MTVMRWHDGVPQQGSVPGTYRAIRPKHLPRCLAEFAYRFDRRCDPAAMVPRLAKASLRTPRMPCRRLELAAAAA